ncbi:MAG: hypothetical protein LBV36_06295 [Chromatiales bacterium]|jgi:hypothetical protein|nr:hypothetical protein [Chromatiales bacterium]
MKKILPFAAALVLTVGTSQALLAESMQPSTGSTGSYKSFEEVDTNGDGQISKEEAKSAGVNINWSQADEDGNDSLSADEYMKAEDGHNSGSKSGGTPLGSESQM